MNTLAVVVLANPFVTLGLCWGFAAAMVAVRLFVDMKGWTP